MDIIFNKKLSSSFDIILILLVYSILALLILKIYNFHLGSDGISYINIATEYFYKEWGNAINAYWSPLYSWLAIPFLFFGRVPQDAALILRCVSLIAGFFTIIGVSRLANVFQFARIIKIFLLITTIPMVLFFAIFYDTPDLLATCLIIYYLGFVFDHNYCNNGFYGVGSGFFGGLAYLAKSFMFPFFMVHYIFLNLFYFFKGLEKNRQTILKNLCLGIGVFLLISGAWIFTLSDHYGKFTISDSAGYNNAIGNLEYPHHPIYLIGLIKPPNPNATSVWEEPSTINVKGWNPLSSTENLNLQFGIIKSNIYRTLIILEYYCLLSFLIIALSFYLIFKKNINKQFKRKLFLLMFTIFIYIAGYVTVALEDRYLWLVNILIIFMGFYLINEYYKTFKTSMMRILLVILMFSGMFSPMYELLIYPNYDNGYNFSTNLKNSYGIHGNLATNYDSTVFQNWRLTLGIAYYTGSKFYGVPEKDDTPSEIQAELEANQIDYYLVWGNSTNVYLTGYNEITGGQIENLRIYARI